MSANIIEVSLYGTLEGQARVTQVLDHLSALYSPDVNPFCTWERTFRRVQALNGLLECRLLTNLAFSEAILCTESPDPQSTAASPVHSKELSARVVTRVAVGDTAEPFLRSMQYEVTSQVARRGFVLTYGRDIVSFFQLCSVEQLPVTSALVPLEPNLWVVEVLIHGSALADLIKEADAWAEILLSEGVLLHPHPPRASKQV